MHDSGSQSNLARGGKKSGPAADNKCLRKTLLIANIVEAILIFIGLCFLILNIFVQGTTNDYWEAF